MTSPAYAAVASLPCTPSHRASVVCSLLIGHLLHCVVVATYSVRTVMRIPRQEQRERHRPRWTSVESPWWSNSRPIQLFWVHRVFCPGAGLCIFMKSSCFDLLTDGLGVSHWQNLVRSLASPNYPCALLRSFSWCCCLLRYGALVIGSTFEPQSLACNEVLSMN